MLLSSCKQEQAAAPVSTDVAGSLHWAVTVSGWQTDVGWLVCMNSYTALEVLPSSGCGDVLCFELFDHLLKAFETSQHVSPASRKHVGGGNRRKVGYDIRSYWR